MSSSGVFLVCVSESDDEVFFGVHRGDGFMGLWVYGGGGILQINDFLVKLFFEIPSSLRCGRDDGATHTAEQAAAGSTVLLLCPLRRRYFLSMVSSHSDRREAREESRTNPHSFYSLLL
jgi:hypothetical protein